MVRQIGNLAKYQKINRPGRLEAWGFVPMSETAAIVSKIVPEIENRLIPALNGLFGGLVRGYLPQAWVFATEKGTATLQVNTSGNASVWDGAASNPDVYVSTTAQALDRALTYHDQAGLPPGALSVRAITGKGQAALNYLRKSLGL